MKVGGPFGYTTNRLIILLFIGHILVTSCVLYFVHRASASALEREQRELVNELRGNLLAEYRNDGFAGLAETIDQHLANSDNRDDVILLTQPDGNPVSGNLVAWPTESRGPRQWTVLDLYRKDSSEPEPIGMTISVLPGGAQLLTGHVLTSNEQLARINRTAVASAIVFAVPISLLIALIVAKVLGYRIRSISSVTEAVRAGDLSRRVPLDGTNGAFDRLSKDINAMLHQLESLVSELRMMTDGLAHDLRSPITRLKSVIEHAMIDTQDDIALDALQKASTESQTLLGMLTIALQISRAEAGIGRERFLPVDMAELLSDLVEVYGPLAEDHNVALTSSAPAGLHPPIHRELLSQALGNLIENALKYADGADQIELSAETWHGEVRLIVADNGPGIPEHRRADAIKRFGRLDEARQTAGSGLGFSLVEAVARLHGGSMELADNTPGLKVILTIES